MRAKFVKWHRDVSLQMRELSQSEWISRDNLYFLQKSKLRKLCATAYKNCLFYKKSFDSIGLKPEKMDACSLTKLPTINKSIIKNNFNDLVSSDFPKEKLIKNATGGSSGEPFDFYQSRHSSIVSAALELRGYKWYGMKQGYPFVKLWGAPTDLQKALIGLKTQIWDYLYNRRNVDAFNAGRILFAEEYLKLKRNPPFLLLSYANILYEFALYIKKYCDSSLEIPAVVSSAGVLYDFQRKAIEEAIAKNLYNRYGSREFGSMAQECNMHNGLHINMERFIIEIDKPDKDGIGGILVTDLENQAFPFIRYRIEDLGQLTESECSCGRHSLILQKVIGRELDVIRTPSGKIISGVMFPHFFKDFHDICLGQVIQDKIDHVEIRLKLMPGSVSKDIEPLIHKISEAIGSDVNISVDFNKAFITNPTGKYRPVISRIKSV